MKKTLNALGILVFSFLICFAALFGAACTGEDEYPQWSVGSLTAAFSDNGRYGYILTVSGEGQMPDYASEKDAPWYGKSGRITQVVIEEGVTYIGANAFRNCAIDSVVLPESVTAVGEKAFPTDADICAYSAVDCADGSKVYLYSQSRPDAEDMYWRYKNGEATIWQTANVLFIGNSFTYYSDIPALFEQIAEGAGEMVEAQKITHGSYTLTKYADANDTAADTSDPNNSGCGALVDSTLKSRSDFDAVVLQEQSTRPLTNYSAFEDAAKALKNKIKNTQDDCEVYLYSTWGYEEAAAERNQTIPELEADIRAAYEKAAEAINAEICPVGAAFSKVYTQYPQINLYYSDAKHPSYAGAFLSACVHAAVILDCDPRTSDFTGELDEDTAQILKTVAYEIVFGS